METNIKKLNSPLAYRYRYDQLNRLTQMRAFDGLDSATNSWPNSSPITAYGENYRYDPNGNILKLNRNGAPSLIPMDSFTYHYTGGTNRLDHVSDVVNSSNYAVDIDNQTGGNYAYDQIGNLIKDEAGCIDSIRWTVYGKVWKIFKCNGDSISFDYYPDGTRAMKEVWFDSLQRKVQTYYIRDASGNELAMYKWVNDDTLTLDQHPIYGSSRLGLWNRNQLVLWYDSAEDEIKTPEGDPDSITYVQSGQRRYELTNHLGNVLATVSDRKLPVYQSNALDHYRAEVTTANDYYPFGMTQPEREFGSPAEVTGYRLDSAYVLNEQFDTTLTGWTHVAGAITITTSAGKLKVMTTGPGFGWKKVFPTQNGKTYRMRYFGTHGAGYVFQVVLQNATSGAFLVSNGYSPYYYNWATSADFTFTATSSSSQVIVGAALSSPDTFYLDYITVQEVIPDTIPVYAKEGYRFSFNGKEKVDEVYGSNNFQDYGERMYDTRLARFPTPDPLIVYGQKYPELSSYQFASNSPIMGIDLDGLELFPVHGTWSNYCDGFSVLEKEDFKSITAATNNTHINPFEWSGYNSDKYRRQAAKALVAQILEQRVEGEPITIVGHSHGGNVGIMATNMLNKMGVKVNYLITINTPVREYQLDKNSPTKQIQIFNDADRVQENGGNSISFLNGSTFLTGEFGKAGRTFDNATNIQVPPVQITPNHNSQQHPELWRDELKETISPTPAKKMDLNYTPQSNKAAQDNTKVAPKYHNPNARF